MSATAISAIVAVHNGRRYLGAALASILQQTAAPSELIVVDDGSTDDSLAVLEGFAAPFAVRVIQQTNTGQSAARNRAAAVAQGDLLAFLDQDDEWHPRHLERLGAPFAQRSELGWVYSDFDEIDGDGNLVTRGFLRENRTGTPKRSVTACVSSDLLALPSASVLRRCAFEAVGGFDESLCGYEDDDLFVRLFRAGWQHELVPESLTRFRIQPGSASSTLRFLRSRVRFCAKLGEMLPDDPRMRRFYMREAVAPRFFQTTLDDYVRACSRRDWVEAREALGALRYFARLRQSSWSLRCKMWLAGNPRRFRLLMALDAKLPGPLRFVRNPLVRLTPEASRAYRATPGSPSPGRPPASPGEAAWRARAAER